MARVKCLMMQRDETVMLEPWLRYYGYLFGYENLVVFDNGSVDRGVLSTLSRYARAGVSVVSDFSDRAAFHNKGVILGSAIRHLDEVLGGETGYDFALPVDCDEFITALTEDGLSCARGTIHAYFDSLIGQRHAFGVELSFYNVPGRTGWFFPNGNRKGFLAAGTIADLDHGYHLPRSRVDDRTVEVPLAYLHFHNRPFEQMRTQAARKLDGLVDVNDLDALRAFRGPGHHLAGYFFIDKDTYRARYDTGVLLGCPPFVDLMEALGVTPGMLDGPADFPPHLGGQTGLWLPERDAAPVMAGAFDGRGYLERSTDVQAARMPPLYHYLLFGRAERRPAPLVDHAPHLSPPARPPVGEGAVPIEPRYSMVGDTHQPPPGATVIDPVTGAAVAAAAGTPVATDAHRPGESAAETTQGGEAPAAPETSAERANESPPSDDGSGWAFRRFAPMIADESETKQW